MIFKCCSKCSIEKNISNFSKAKKYADGYKSQCRDCDKLYKIKNKKAEQERNRIYREKNKEKIKEKKRQYYSINKSSIINRTSIYNKQKLSNDINYKIAKNLRTRLYCAIKNGQKAGSAVKDLGCSIEDFKTHIESLWQPNMNWSNWNQTGWHIDHIVPLASFDLTNEEEFKKACHYTNLQPLWAEENYEKSDNI